MLVEISDPFKIVASVNAPTHYPGPLLTETTTKIIDFVENSEHKVMPSGAYLYVRESWEAGKVVSRAGYFFRFWFSEMNSAKEFASLIGGTLEIPPILPRSMQSTLHRDTIMP